MQTNKNYKIRIIKNLQESIYNSYDYEQWRKELIENCQNQILTLNTELIEVHSRLLYVEKYKNRDTFNILTDINVAELTREIAPIVVLNDFDEFAKRFDNLIYNIIIEYMEDLPNFNNSKKKLQNIASNLQNKTSIPQVKNKVSLITEINTDKFWKNINILLLEKVRKDLRSLIQFLDDNNNKQNIIITNLQDEIISKQEGRQLEVSYDFEDYRNKVSRYIKEHSDITSVYKLTHNIPLSKEDFEELERILIVELGTEEDYKKEFGETPFGLLVRKVAKMNHQSIMETFSKFINDQSLNSEQIDFVKKIINYIEQNGYMDSMMLQKPPFDKPVNFIKLFNTKTRNEIIKTISDLKENAINIIA